MMSASSLRRKGHLCTVLAVRDMLERAKAMK